MKRATPTAKAVKKAAKAEGDSTKSPTGMFAAACPPSMGERVAAHAHFAASDLLHEHPDVKRVKKQLQTKLKSAIHGAFRQVKAG